MVPNNYHFWAVFDYKVMSGLVRHAAGQMPRMTVVQDDTFSNRSGSDRILGGLLSVSLFNTVNFTFLKFK